MEDEFANYIPLKEATTLCDYSQDYLNLLVRKGKLRALKIGRNWVTKKEWVQEYLTAIEQKKSKIAQRNIVRSAMVAPRVGLELPIAEKITIVQNPGPEIKNIETIQKINNEIINTDCCAKQKVEIGAPLALIYHWVSFLRLNKVLAAGCFALCLAAVFGAVFLSQRATFVAGSGYLSANLSAMPKLGNAQNIVIQSGMKASFGKVFGSAERMLAVAADDFSAGFNGIAAQFKDTL